MVRRFGRLAIAFAVTFVLPTRAAISAEQKVEQKAAQNAEPKAAVAEKAKKVEQKPAKPAADSKDAITTLIDALFDNGNNTKVVKVVPNWQNEAMVKQLLPQYMEQYRPALTAELTFIRQVGDLPKEHRPKIKAAGEKSLETSVREMVEMQLGRNGRIVRRNSSEFDPTKRIREALQQGLKESLTPEQFAQYRQEASERANRHKRAAIFYVISQIDSVLSLSSEQRDQIYESIESNWQEKWENWLNLQNYGGQYFPQIPDQLIATHLNQDQTQVWNGLQKIEVGVMAINRGEAAENDDWWGDEAAAPQNQPVLNLVPAIAN
jgi:hypothetical protein